MMRSLRRLRQLDWLAAQSSAIGEDEVAASFAGQNLTRLAIPPDRLAPAMAEVARCATTQGAAFKLVGTSKRWTTSLSIVALST